MTNKRKDKSQKPKRSNVVEPNEDSPLAELRQHLSNRPAWAPHFQRLAEAIAEVSGPETTSMESSQTETSSDQDCETYNDLIDLYTYDELEGYDVRHLYPQVWEHLQSCRRCHQTYEMLVNTLKQTQAGQLPAENPATSPLPFLRPQAADGPWIARLQSRLTGVPFKLTFAFNQAYLQTLLSPLNPVAVRAESSGLLRPSHLLLHETIPVGSQILTVEVTATEYPEKPGVLNIQATLADDSAWLPENLWAKLIWAGQTYAAPVDKQGQVNFGEVSLTSLKEALETQTGSFELTIEVE